MLGKKTGGRQKGTPNKVTEELKRDIAASGETPLEYMLRVMRDGEADEARRDKMAAAAAPYLHARLESVEQTILGANGRPISPTINLTGQPPAQSEQPQSSPPPEAVESVSKPLH